MKMNESTTNARGKVYEMNMSGTSVHNGSGGDQELDSKNGDNNSFTSKRCEIEKKDGADGTTTMRNDPPPTSLRQKKMLETQNEENEDDKFICFENGGDETEQNIVDLSVKSSIKLSINEGNMQLKRTREPARMEQSPDIVARKKRKVVQIDDDKLYKFLTTRPDHANYSSVVVNMYGCFLDRNDCYTLSPRRWLNATVVTMACKVFLNQQKISEGKVKRHIFTPDFAVKVIMDLGTDRTYGCSPWNVSEMEKFVCPVTLGYNITECEMIFIPVCFKNHWFCMAVDMVKGQIDILDSLIRSDSGRQVLEQRLRQRLYELISHANLKTDIPISSYELNHPEMPQQPNTYDCGIYAIKYLELWDGKHMPEFTQEQLNGFRKELLLSWVRHEDNSACNSVLQGVK